MVVRYNSVYNWANKATYQTSPAVLIGHKSLKQDATDGGHHKAEDDAEIEILGGGFSIL
jgi:hypothetical protein